MEVHDWRECVCNGEDWFVLGEGDRVRAIVSKIVHVGVLRTCEFFNVALFEL